MDLKNTKELINFFKSLPDKYGERGFELQLTTEINNSLSDLESRFRFLESRLREILNHNKSSKIKYAAFYSLAILYRRTKKYDKADKLFDPSHDNKLYEQFFKMVLFSHVELLHKLSSGKDLTDSDVATAEENSEAHFENAGVVHLFADIAATFYEKRYSEITKDEDKACIDKAITAVKRAIKLDGSYVKYRCTKSRLLFLKGDIKEALKEINEAISKVSPDSTDYITYQDHKMKIAVEHGKQEIRSKIEIMEKELSQKQEALSAKQKDIEKSLIKNIEFIGFFAGVIALVLGGLQIGMSQRLLMDAVKLIIVLFACLLCVFAGFGVILHGFDKKHSLPNLIVFVIGLGAIGVALFCL